VACPRIALCDSPQLSDVPLEDPSWKANDQLEFGRLSPYKNRIPAETMLFLGRCVMIFLTLCLELALAVRTRRRFGAPAAPGALAAGFERDQRGALYQRLSLRRENQSNSSRRSLRLRGKQPGRSEVKPRSL